jgi:hypothetical protein
MAEPRPPLVTPSAGANVHVQGDSVVLLPAQIPLRMSGPAAAALAERLRVAAMEAIRNETPNGAN